MGNSINYYDCRQFSAFTMDVIARCAFGMTIENLGEKDDPFMRNAKYVFSPPVNKTPLILILCTYIHIFRYIICYLYKVFKAFILLNFNVLSINSYLSKVAAYYWRKDLLH